MHNSVRILEVELENRNNEGGTCMPELENKSNAEDTYKLE
jgi:hypothetical protein